MELGQKNEIKLKTRNKNSVNAQNGDKNGFRDESLPYP